MKGLKFISTGRAIPEKVVTNDDMSRIVDTSDEWIRTRTGIAQRHFCTRENAASLAVSAARQALERAGISPEEIGVCAAATVTPQYASPANACLIQAALGLAEDTPCFDLSAGCTGFLYGLEVMRGMLTISPKRYALLVGGEELSRVMDMTDRSTCVLFGDGAGAAVLALEENALWAATLGTRGNPDILSVDAVGKGPSYIHMDGQGVYRFAVEVIPHCAKELLAQTGLTLEQVDWIVPHQANRRIVETAAKRLHLGMDKFFLNIDRYGNTSAASIPIALDEMVQEGLLRKGQKVMAIAFGAGLTWGGALFEW